MSDTQEEYEEYKAELATLALQTNQTVKEILLKIGKMNVEDLHESYIEDMFGEHIMVGFLVVPTVTAMKILDPVAYRCDKNDYVSGIIEGDFGITFDNGSTYYYKSDVSDYLDEHLKEKE